MRGDPLQLSNLASVTMRADSTFDTVISVIHPHEHHSPFPQHQYIMAMSIIRSKHPVVVIAASGTLNHT
eukprot:6469819-Ditylum_brightwellii.AAC.2